MMDAVEVIFPSSMISLKRQTAFHISMDTPLVNTAQKCLTFKEHIFK